MEEEIYSGIIKGEEKDQDALNECMLILVSSIKEELLMKYPQEISDFYIYHKYDEKKKNFKNICHIIKRDKNKL